MCIMAWRMWYIKQDMIWRLGIEENLFEKILVVYIMCFNVCLLEYRVSGTSIGGAG